MSDPLEWWKNAARNNARGMRRARTEAKRRSRQNKALRDEITRLRRRIDKQKRLLCAVRNRQKMLLGQKKPPAFAAEIKPLLKAHRCSWSAITGGSKRAPIRAARWAVIWFFYCKGWSYNRIAEFMGKDHSSIRYAVLKINERGTS